MGLQVSWAKTNWKTTRQHCVRTSGMRNCSGCKPGKQTAETLFSAPIRASKPSGAPLVLLLTLRSKVATGGSLLTTATRKPQQGELFRESATLRSSVTEGSSRAERSPPLCAFAENSFATARRTVAMGRMKPLAVCFFELTLDTSLTLISPQTLKTTPTELPLATRQSAACPIAFALNLGPRCQGTSVLTALTA